MPNPNSNPQELFMNYVPVILVLAALSNSSEPTDYRTAFDRAMKGDKPLLVLVTAEWCPPCQMMKKTTIPDLISANQLKGCHFAMVDLDRDSNDARNLIGNGTVPQLILFEKHEGNWKTRKLMGYSPPEAVVSFIGESKPVLTANAQILASDQ